MVKSCTKQSRGSRKLGVDALPLYNIQALQPRRILKPYTSMHFLFVVKRFARRNLAYLAVKILHGRYPKVEGFDTESKKK